MQITDNHYIWFEGEDIAGSRGAFFSKLDGTKLVGLDISLLSVKEILDKYNTGLDKIYRLAITSSDDRDPAQEYSDSVLAIWQVEEEEEEPDQDAQDQDEL